MFLGQEQQATMQTAAPAQPRKSSMEMLQAAVPETVKGNAQFIAVLVWIILQVVAIGLCFSGWVLAADDFFKNISSTKLKNGLRFQIVWPSLLVIVFAVFSLLIFTRFIKNSLYMHAVTVTSLVGLINLNLLSIAYYADADTKKEKAWLAFNTLYMVAAMIMILVLVLFRDLLFGNTTDVSTAHTLAMGGTPEEKEGLAPQVQP